MAATRTKKAKNKKTPLSIKIERQVSDPHQFDGEDADLLSYVDHFISKEVKLPPMEPFSLLTVESAQVALEQITRTQALIESKMRTAGALKKLLEAKKQ